MDNGSCDDGNDNEGVGLTLSQQFFDQNTLGRDRKNETNLFVGKKIENKAKLLVDSRDEIIKWSSLFGQFIDSSSLRKHLEYSPACNFPFKPFQVQRIFASSGQNKFHVEKRYCKDPIIPWF